MIGIRLAAAVLLAGCATHAPTGAPSLAPPLDEDDPAARRGLVGDALDGYRAAYLLTWNGARIGEAREWFVAAEQGGHRFERTERVVVRRAGQLATLRTTIAVDLDEWVTPQRIEVLREGGVSRTRTEATREQDGTWRVLHGTAPERLVDGAAVPSTLVPLLVAAGHAAPGRAFGGPVLVEGAALSLAHVTVTIAADGASARAELATAVGRLRGEVRLDERGFVVAAGLGAALQSQRVDEVLLAATFEPPEIVDSAALTVAGAASTGSGLRLTLEGVAAAPPVVPELAEQSVVIGPEGAWEVFVEATTPQPSLAKVRARTRRVSDFLRDDLSLSAFTPEEALAARAGDCTAHAVLLAAELADDGYDTRLVTGYLLDDGALRRHRWVLVKLPHRWLAVDPMYDEVPASSAHFALAVHGASPDELAFIDDVAFAGWGSATARFAE